MAPRKDFALPLGLILLGVMLYVGSYIYLRGRPAYKTLGPLDLETMHAELFELGPVLPPFLVKPANLFYAPCRFADEASTGVEVEFRAR